MDSDFISSLHKTVSLFFFVLLFGSLTQYSFCQFQQIEHTLGSTISSTNAIFLDDLFKQPYKQNVNPDVKGSPFFIDDWKYADLILRGGQRFNRIKVRLNLFTQELNYLASGNTEIILKDGIIARMILYDTSEAGLPVIRQFISGIPVVDKDTSFPFFELITEGKALLLNLDKKKINDAKDALSQTGGKEFVNSVSLYILINNELKKCNKSNEFFINIFADKRDSIESFIKVRKLKCRNREDVINLVQYYNTL